MEIKRTVVNELHKPARKNFKRRRTIVKGLHDLFQADLVEMIPYSKVNKSFKYILVVINAFSKFAWAKPLKTKNGRDVTKAMRSILILTKPPKNLQTDQGKEFFNADFQKLMKDFNINHYTTYSSVKASIVERLNRTLKGMMWKEFSYRGNYKWTDILEKLVTKYNNTYHKTIGMKPINVNSKNESIILKQSFTKLKTIDPRGLKFKSGDSVRISKFRDLFEKGYTPNWSNEIFKIKKVQMTNPTTYILEDEEKKPILGGFYEKELQKVTYPDVYLVEKVIKRKRNKVLVKWLGLPSSKNSWIDSKNKL